MPLISAREARRARYWAIAVRCAPCLRIHLKSALTMGLSKAEIDEAAGLAIAFGGCSALMFYKEICEELKVA